MLLTNYFINPLCCVLAYQSQSKGVDNFSNTQTVLTALTFASLENKQMITLSSRCLTLSAPPATFLNF